MKVKQKSKTDKCNVTPVKSDKTSISRNNGYVQKIWMGAGYIDRFEGLGPEDWSCDEVQEWLKWSIKEYSLGDVDPSSFNMNGKALCMLEKEDFLKRCPNMGDLLYNSLHKNMDRAPCAEKWRSSSVPPLDYSMKSKSRVTSPRHTRRHSDETNSSSSSHVGVAKKQKRTHTFGPPSHSPRIHIEAIDEPLNLKVPPPAHSHHRSHTYANQDLFYMNQDLKNHPGSAQYSYTNYPNPTRRMYDIYDKTYLTNANSYPSSAALKSSIEQNIPGGVNPIGVLIPDTNATIQNNGKADDSVPIASPVSILKNELCQLKIEQAQSQKRSAGDNGIDHCNGNLRYQSGATGNGTTGSSAFDFSSDISKNVSTSISPAIATCAIEVSFAPTSKCDTTYRARSINGSNQRNNHSEQTRYRSTGNYYDDLNKYVGSDNKTVPLECKAEANIKVPLSLGIARPNHNLLPVNLEIDTSKKQVQNHLYIEEIFSFDRRNKNNVADDVHTSSAHVNNNNTLNGDFNGVQLCEVSHASNQSISSKQIFLNTQTIQSNNNYKAVADAKNQNIDSRRSNTQYQVLQDDINDNGLPNNNTHVAHTPMDTNVINIKTEGFHDNFPFTGSTMDNGHQNGPVRDGQSSTGKEATSPRLESIEPMNDSLDTSFDDDLIKVEEEEDAIEHTTGSQGSDQTKVSLLWEFIDELLKNDEHNKLVRWTDKSNLCFRIIDTAGLANLWGQRKRKNNMTYEKLSRALRYYYKMKIIGKVPGRRLHYKFLVPPDKIKRGIRGARPGVPHHRRNPNLQTSSSTHFNENIHLYTQNLVKIAPKSPINIGSLSDTGLFNVNQGSIISQPIGSVACQNNTGLTVSSCLSSAENNLIPLPVIKIANSSDLPCLSHSNLYPKSYSKPIFVSNVSGDTGAPVLSANSEENRQHIETKPLILTNPLAKGNVMGNGSNLTSDDYGTCNRSGHAIDICKTPDVSKQGDVATIDSVIQATKMPVLTHLITNGPNTSPTQATNVSAVSANNEQNTLVIPVPCVISSDSGPQSPATHAISDEKTTILNMNSANLTGSTPMSKSIINTNGPGLIVTSVASASESKTLPYRRPYVDTVQNGSDTKVQATSPNVMQNSGARSVSVTKGNALNVPIEDACSMSVDTTSTNESSVQIEDTCSTSVDTKSKLCVLKDDTCSLNVDTTTLVCTLTSQTVSDLGVQGTGCSKSVDDCHIDEIDNDFLSENQLVIDESGR